MKSLIFMTAFLCATSAMASEITSPFYLPQTGHFLARTQGQFSKAKQTPGIRTYRRLLNEDLTIGLGAGLAAQIIGNLNWTRQKQNTTVSAPHAQGYTAGLKGQWEIGKIITQLTALYSQTTDVNFSPRRTIEPHLRLGQELNTMTPYLHLWGQFPLNARPEFNNPFYRAETGVFQKVNDKITLDSALYLQYDKNIKGKAYGIQGELSYLATSWMSVGLNASWQARGHAKGGEKTYHQSVGAVVRFAF